MFGKLMSISDELMWRYFELLSFRPLGEIAALHNAVDEGRNPRDVKFELAREIVARFHVRGCRGARAAAISPPGFSEKALPTDLPEQAASKSDGADRSPDRILKEAGLGRQHLRGERVKSRKVRCGSTERRSAATVTQLPRPEHLYRVGSARSHAQVKLAKSRVSPRLDVDSGAKIRE